MLCNMDKKTFINRSFSFRELENDPKVGAVKCIFMVSSYEGEFGSVSIVIAAEIEGPELLLVSRFREKSAELPAALFNFRSHEVDYFVRQIVPLFNPLNLFQDEIPFPSQESPSNS